MSHKKCQPLNYTFQTFIFSTMLSVSVSATLVCGIERKKVWKYGDYNLLPPDVHILCLVICWSYSPPIPQMFLPWGAKINWLPVMPVAELL